ncbi:MAG: metabolite traffic protein EboE [Verrucomicrobiae bacterium]|nr:metabolite traffic protein EboE [Verrucomicrobiae bacterium]
MVRQRPSVGYCLNVFPDETLAGLKQTLRRRASRIRRLACGNRALPVELRLSQRMVNELRANSRETESLRDLLRAERLRLVALNAFVPVSFHQPNLKERVYLPAWHESDERLRYTCACADLLAALAPPEVVQPSLSVPAGVLKRDFADTPNIHASVASALRRCAEHCERLERRAGRRIVVALEPEPGLTLERTEEVVRFFHQYFPQRKGTDAARRYLGINFDICHQLVEFEDPWASVAALERAGIAVFKVHVSNAIEIAKPLIAAELLEALRLRYAESKFLHQVCGVNPRGRLVYFSLDLPQALAPDGLRAMARAGVERIRVHYHIPLLPAGNMPTTLGAVEAFVRRLAKARPSVPLVIETYTWLEQLAAVGARRDLSANIAAEIRYVRGWLR